MGLRHQDPFAARSIRYLYNMKSVNSESNSRFRLIRAALELTMSAFGHSVANDKTVFQSNEALTATEDSQDSPPNKGK